MLLGVVSVAIALGLAWGLAVRWHETAEKRVCVVIPGRIIRGAWQDPDALRRIIARERIKTIVTLTAINRDDAKYVEQSKVVRETGVDWIIVPMKGSSGTVEQLARAADLLADNSRQPVFFHCVAGHHRSSEVHAAYLIRHHGWSAESAWRVVAALPWARPLAPADQNDRERIEAFAQLQSSMAPASEADEREVQDEDTPEADRQSDRRADRGGLACDDPLHRMGPGELQLRRGPAGPSLSLRPNVSDGTGANRP
jgi:protein tyrosine phosphatase (PTP) superfamily phosphohydrolase (DUF442 family)